MYSITRGEGTPLLCLHGFPLTHKSLLPLDESFAKEGQWKRIYVDLPGMGRSADSKDVQGYQAVLEALKQFVAREIGQEKYAIFGYSFGAILGRALAQATPEQILGLGFLCPEIISDPAQSTLPPRAPVETDKRFIAGLSPDDRQSYTATSIVETRENWTLFSEYILPAFSEFNEGGITSIAADPTLTGIPEPDGYTFNRPTLFVHGRQDNMAGYVDAFNILDHYPHATYVVLDRAGHTAHLDQQHLVSQVVIDWLLRVSRAEKERNSQTRGSGTSALEYGEGH